MGLSMGDATFGTTVANLGFIPWRSGDDISYAVSRKSEKDSCRESGVVAGPFEQTDTTYLQDDEPG